MYDRLAAFSAIWGLLFFVAVFAVVLAYALWPGNRDTFARAARQALDGEDGPEPRGDASP